LSFLGFEISTAFREALQNFLRRVTKLFAFSPFSGVLPNVKHIAIAFEKQANRLAEGLH